MNFPLLFMSFGVGILIGLTGMGGAALMAPFLILVVGVRPVTAVGTDLAYGAVTKIIGAWAHHRQDSVDMKVVHKLAIGSIPGGLAGSMVVVLLPRYTHGAERYVRTAIGGLLILVAIILIARMVFPVRTDGLSARTRLRLLEGRTISVWGALVGFCVGATSVGSGSLLAPFLMLLYPARAITAVGTDVFHAAILVTVTGAVHAGASGVEWELMPMLLGGSIPGVLLGSKLAARVPSRPLRMGMAAVLAFSGYRML
jgi:uncharacterized membrane protein YfcA